MPDNPSFDQFGLNTPINLITEKYNIQFLVYFGSFQTPYYNRDSDIDIGFLTLRPLDANDRMNLLEELIKFHRKSEIDLVDLIKAEPILKYEIARTGRVFYEKETGLFERYSLYYIKKFYELKPAIEAEMKMIGDSIKELLENG
jgi:predicted nucleotidyltransferase